MVDLLIKNARVIDPSQQLDKKCDIFISDGKIKDIAPSLSYNCDNIIEADGLVAAPGLIDLHVHLREPGFTHKEDIISGSNAAAAGGVTTVVAMPNTKPVADCPEIIEQINDIASKAKVNVKQVGAITVGQAGERLTDFEALKKAGVVAFSDDGVPVATAKLMHDALIKADELNLPILAHCEEKTLSGKGKINLSDISEKLGIDGIPNAAEDVGTAREICLADDTDTRVHICHVSTRQSIAMIKSAKNNGVKVTCETCPHYFVFNEEKMLLQDADYRMNPPLRSEKDRLAVIEGIKDGTIDVIATDHAPHSQEEKADFKNAMNGVVGMETSLSASITYLVKNNIIDLNRLIYMMSCKPAEILGLKNIGTLKKDANADIVLFDLNEKWTVDTDKLHGKSKNAVFKGVELTGKVKYTVCNGNIVYKD